jgi:hypothetical protein
MSSVVLKTNERYLQTRLLRHSVQLEKLCHNYIAYNVVLDLGRKFTVLSKNTDKC